MEDNRYKPPDATVADIDPSVPGLARPAVVRYGVWMLWLQCLIGVPGIVYGMIKPPVEVSSGIAQIAFLVGMAMAVGFIGLFAWFAWMAWKGRNWARIVYLVFLSLGLLFAYWTVRMTFAQSTYDGVVSLTQTLLSLVGVVLLFTPAANAWYRAMRR